MSEEEKEGEMNFGEETPLMSEGEVPAEEAKKTEKKGKASAAAKVEAVKQPSADKLAALKMAMAKIDKDMGKGTVMRMGDNKVEDIPVISTGSIGLDHALGVRSAQRPYH